MEDGGGGFSAHQVFLPILGWWMQRLANIAILAKLLDFDPTLRLSKFSKLLTKFRGKKSNLFEFPLPLIRSEWLKFHCLEK